mmetsp:Transcript_1932/g.4922  ORF Transcript_1932/g.4922 Transcript_1932/m.4922 type:complete len:201 (-) Transcript_1932:348-950(-)
MPVCTAPSSRQRATACGSDCSPFLKLPSAPPCTRSFIICAPSRHCCANSSDLRSACSSAKRSRPPESNPAFEPRASRLKIFLSAHFMASLEGSPAYTPETNGSITFSNTSRPRCRDTKLSIDSSSSPLYGCSTPGMPRAPSAARILPGHETRSKLSAPSTRGLLSGSGYRFPSKYTRRGSLASASTSSSASPTSCASLRI